jgi:hypothetical protein
MPKRLFLLTALLALLGSAPTSAWGSEQELVSIPNQTLLTAYGGHVVWNEFDPSGLWYLTDWHGGNVSRLPIPPRTVPFDVDLGPAGDGRPVAVYSRCRQEPGTGRAVPPAPPADWMTARGCDLFEFGLETGKERRLEGVSSRRGSETTPSIWRGATAFARRLPGRPKARLYLKRPNDRHLIRLPGGTLPLCVRIREAIVEPHVCGSREPRPYAGADALDLGPRSLAFLWRLSNGNVVGTGVAWELRLDPLTGRRGTIASSGLIGGACEIFLPQSPNAFGRRVLFLERIGECTVTRAPIALFDPRNGGALRQATPAAGLAYAIARDGRTVYWLRGPSPEPQDTPPADAACGIGPGACFLVRSSDLAFRRVRHHKAEPPVF